jgi:hypothetical protein
MISKSSPHLPDSPARDPAAPTAVSVIAAVQAQVMSRSEKFGGWLPHSGGGMSHVLLLRKRGDRSGTRSGSSASSSASSEASVSGYRSSEAISQETAVTSSTTTSPSPPSSSSSSPIGTSMSDLMDSAEDQEDQYQIIATRISDENVSPYLWCWSRRSCNQCVVSLPVIHVAGCTGLFNQKRYRVQ